MSVILNKEAIMAISTILIILLYMNIGVVSADRLYPDSEETTWLMQVGFWPVALIISICTSWRKTKPSKEEDLE